MPDLGWYALVLVVAAVATAGLTVPARRFAVLTGYVAPPNERTMHTKAIPYGGGAAMFLGFLTAVLAAAAIPALRPIFSDSPELLGVVLAAGAIFAVGLIDDIREMSAPAKMAGQILAASILYFLGVTMYDFKVPLAGFIVLTPGVIPLITAAWVIALANAINLIDGLDGLAAGIVAIGGGALAIYGLRLMALGILPVNNVGPLVAVIACGICLGFLPFNFSPARLFMGDAGALLLGVLMAASTMVIGGRTPPTSGVTYFFFAPLFIPFFILGVPIVDMAFAFVRRTARGTSFHTPDKQHIHHRLLRLGHGPRRSVLILWAWTAVLSAFLLVPLFVHRANAFIPLGAAALGVGLYTLFHPGLRKGNGDGGDAEDEAVSGAVGGAASGKRLDPEVPAAGHAAAHPGAPAPAQSAEVVRLP